jgi:hypothetical protein
MSSSKLWMNARGSGTGTKGLHTPYVVKFHNSFDLAPAQPLFTFTHPNPSPPHLVDNSRYGGTSLHCLHLACLSI